MRYTRGTLREKVGVVDEKIRQLTFLQSFGYLALALGLIIEVYALFNGLGTRLSSDDMSGVRWS